jgi:hypothetical protein
MRIVPGTTCLATIVPLLAACGSSTSNNAGGSPTDGGSGTDAGSAQDSGMPSGDGSADAAPNCGAVPPSGTQIVAAPTQLVVQGLTTDGKYVLYADTNAQTLSVVPVAGGQAVMVGPFTIQGGFTFAARAGGAVYFSSGSPQTNIATLTAWTPGVGPVEIAKNAALVGGFDISPDGSLVAYFATSDGNTGVLTVSTADGKTQTPLAMNVDLQNCPADAQFVQPDPSSPPVLVAAYCDQSSADAGGAPGGLVGPPETIATFAGAGFTKTAIGTFDEMTVPFTILVDPKGTQLLLSGASGLALYPIAGGTPKTVDANAVANSALFASNGDVVYSTSGGAVNRYSTATGMATTLLATGSYSVQTLSLDGNWMQLSQNVNQTTGGSDVFLASATAAGMATSEWTMQTANPNGFTSDSRFEFFAVSSATLQSMTADLYASPVTGGALGKVATVAGAVALAGSSIAVADNYRTAGTTDIEVIDLSNPTAKKTLVTQADPTMKVTPTNRIVYSWYCELNAMAGLWVAP